MPMLPDKAFNFDFTISTTGAFMQGFGELFQDPLQCVVVLFSFIFVDFFDTAGTLVAVANRIGIVNEKGEVENIERALFGDAIGSVAGSILGTSTVTSYVESTAGVGVGGKTGLTACTTGVLFLVSIFISPIILTSVTNAVTAPALVVVGILMAQQLKEIDWDDFVAATAGFVTVIIMVLTYSIADGIAIGFIAYAVAMIASGKAKQINKSVWALLVIFILYFMI